VEYHLSNVYRKLSIRGRADLASALDLASSGRAASSTTP
jgi:DNA-binding CsgD family transcriptional regulator